MKYFSIMDDFCAHTVIYLVKAKTKKEALEIYAEEQLSLEKLPNNKWHIIDDDGKKTGKFYNTIYEVIKGETINRPGDRFEIMEVPFFDLNEKCLEIFCSKEKTLEDQIFSKKIKSIKNKDAIITLSVKYPNKNK